MQKSTPSSTLVILGLMGLLLLVVVGVQLFFWVFEG
jgi:hypothetical protein